MPALRITCGRCGFDRRLGRRSLSAEPPRGPRRLRFLLLGGIFALAIIVALALQGGFSMDPRKRPQPPEPVARIESPAAVATTPSSTDAPFAPAPQTSESPELDGHRETVRAKLDQNRPLYEPGQEIELRTSIGQIKRGILVARLTDRIVMQPKEGGTETVGFSSLDNLTRLRCDPAYRDQYIEYRSRQLAEGFEGP